MANLRILSVNVIDSTTIIAQFTDKLDPSINATNITVAAQYTGVPSPEVLTVSVVNDTLTFTTQPLTPQSSYLVTFQSTPEIIFKSLNGTSVLFQDGVTNSSMIIGPTETENPVQQFLFNYLNNNIYNVTDSSTLVYSLIQSLSTILSKALYDIKQVKNENYISFNVVDEPKVRGSGPFDRLSEESAYQVLRVGLTPTGTNSTLETSINYFPEYPITLLANPYTDSCVSSVTNSLLTFNTVDFILNLSNKNVSKLISVTFNYTDGRAPYVYNIDTYGYQILNSEYDQNYAFAYALLNSNQIKLSGSILSDTAFSTQNIFSVQVSYEFKNLGRIIDTSTVTVTNILKSVRETLPPIINVFNLAKSPIVDSSGDVPTTGGVTFLDPNAFAGALHPAFVTELPFNLGALPYAIGQYSIDYSTATVYVYGSDISNSGTGPTPPLATYNYLYTYQDSLDYTYDDSTQDLVALPTGNLYENPGTISYNYEQVLIPGVDYNSSPHVEVLSESIQNRLLALNVLSVENNPVTDVFRIYNQTSGEIYGITRWENNKVYFTYNNPPNVEQILAERVTFNLILNETLFVNEQLINTSNLLIYKCLLNSNTIISGTEDSVASKINTSVYFSDTDVFKTEMWWDSSGVETDQTNLGRLTTVGQYQIDYKNGIVYVAVVSNQEIDIGTISYKSNQINTTEDHIISVDDLYYRVSLINPKDKVFQYDNFGDASIVPLGLDNSDEGFLNQVTDAPYQVYNRTVGAFVDTNFIGGVTNNIKFLRSVYEYNDLQFNSNPINFFNSSTFNNKIVTISTLTEQEINSVLFDGTHYYLNLSLNIPYFSPNITQTYSVTRMSDGAQLWSGSGTVVAGSPVKLVLPGTNVPQAGDLVTVQYTFTINDLSRIILDYNRGEFYADYTYLVDEILVSYEYGDNVLDFRQTNSLQVNDNYYASYKVGALRDALLKNFGSLINVPELTTFDVDLERERYRDAVTGALESFIVGPTVQAMKNLVQAITHIEPQLIESAFQNWSLGSSLLNPRGLESSDAVTLAPAKYDNGAVMEEPGATITFPLSSNLKLEEGSFQAWISPQWNGIDNDAPLTISVLKDGVPVPETFVFLGAAEYHPEYDFTGTFTVGKNDNVIGIPNTNKDGVFIYYANDPSNLFQRWYFNVVDGSNNASHTYTVKINTPGVFYSVRSISSPQSANISIQSGIKTSSFRITSSTVINDGVTFIADFEHFILDFGQNNNTNRLSLFKDPSGYLNFRIYDKNHRAYTLSANVSAWTTQQLHHVAISWKLNNKNKQDEMHLFVDGFEVPNIARYGDKVGPYLHENFRTINPEEIAGMITKNIVGSTDLTVTAGSNVVSSSLDFSAYGINIGDIIYINEIGFNTAGYTITAENGNDLTLNQTMPISLTDGNFSINTTSLTVQTEINLFPNIAVSTISTFYSATDLVTTVNSSTINSASTNFQSIGLIAGDLIRIDNAMFNTHYVVLSVGTNSLVVNDTMPESMSQLSFHVYHNDPVEIPGVRALNSSYSISYDGYFDNVLTLNNSVKAYDLIFISTLGLNHRRITPKFYVWGNESNVIQTRMASPVDLETVGIYHILLDKQIINQSNSTVAGSNFTYTTTNVEAPSPSDNGRTLQVSVSTTNNLTFPLTVTLDGYSNETLTFTNVGSLTTNIKFQELTSVTVSGTAVNLNKSFATIEISEAKSITVPESSKLYPVIRYSYQTNAGTNLISSGGDTVTDGYNFFSTLNIGSYLLVTYPSNAAGTYQIVSISDDHSSMVVDGSLPAFTGGVYQVLNTTDYRSGLQNGFFTLEQAALPGTPYLLNQGTYMFDFYTYLSIPFDPLNVDVYLGTDFYGEKILNGTIDEVKITSIKLTDTRIGETIPSTQESITKDFNSIKALTSDINTLVLSHFDTLPLTNSSPFYTSTASKQNIQLGLNINDNFGQSIYLSEKPLIIENDAVLNSKQEGTIEFWVNPIYDTANDPNFRYYFDASGVEIETVTSLDDVTVQTQGRIKKILSVTLQAGDQSVDYFAGGKVEFSTVGAIAENAFSTSASVVSVSKKIAQVITVKIVGDATNTDYFDGGSIGQDGSTIYLGKVLPQSSLALIVTYKVLNGANPVLNSQVIRLNKRLPSQNTPVIVTYIPTGLQGDRISIFKDPAGYVNFSILASGIDYVVRAPVYWPAGTWHRLKASYSVNNGNGTDTLHLFVDGYEYGNILFGENLIFGGPYVFGSTFGGRGSGIQTNINVKDFFGEIYIGNSFKGKSPAYILINNLRISNLSRPLFTPFGESIDVNYNSNLNMAIPVTKDLYTTYLLSLDEIYTQNTNFIMLTNKTTGIFDFTLNIFDSFDILKNSAKTQELLETLIKILKPANSQVFINYLT